jgi:uncharacterized membrane protein
MIWYLWISLSLISGSLEEVVDKMVTVRQTDKIDSLSASFYRNLVFFLFTIISGIIGIFGKIDLVFNIHFLILAIIWPLNSLAYDYFLRNVELSRFNGISYTYPFIFLLIDFFHFHQAYSALQINGSILLATGAILFSYDRKQDKLFFSYKGMFWLLINMTTNIYLLFVFKHLSNLVNEVSFYFSIWLFVIIFYIFLLIITKKYKKLKQTANTNRFISKTFLSKGFDFLSSIFYLKAINIASLTAVSSISSFSPLVLLILLLIISFMTNINIEEDFSKKSLGLKIIATFILVIGGFFMVYF